MTPVRLGFIPLDDCAPLVVAREKGFFAAEGLAVELSREPSWANIRDKVATGAFEAAHMLAPMAVAAGLGLGAHPFPVVAPLALNRHGAAITLSAVLALDAEPLARTAKVRSEAGAPLRFAMVFPYSAHAYHLRGWLADQGLDPNRDVRLTVTPPQRMGEALAAGDIDGFCAGEPWNALAMAAGSGVVVARSAELWPGAPDKVLGVSSAWAGAHPDVLGRLVGALGRAAAWADANPAELAALLARPDYVGAPEALIAASLQGIVFARDGAGRPALDDERWCLDQMRRWGQIETIPAPGQVFRPDLFDAFTA